MKPLTGSLLLTAAVLGLAARGGAEEKPAEKKVDTRVFELRIYTAEAGKMDALKARFRDHTVKLFEKHGMTNVAYWTELTPKGEEKLYYVLAYPSKEAADKSWAAFRVDPDWKKAKDASEKDGPLVKKVESIYLKPTDFSAIK
jgi:hypothetical protein